LPIFIFISHVGRPPRYEYRFDPFHPHAESAMDGKKRNLSLCMCVRPLDLRATTRRFCLCLMNCCAPKIVESSLLLLEVSNPISVLDAKSEKQLFACNRFQLSALFKGMHARKRGAKMFQPPQLMADVDAHQVNKRP
jgi:hypothetical protein